MKVALFIVIGLAAAAIGIAASAPDADATPTAAEVYKRTMSPFCPGVTLRDCASAPALQLRGEISKKVAAGATNEQIDSWLVESFGPKVLGAPKGASVWVAPLTMAAIGVGVVAFVLRQRDMGSRTEQRDMGSRTEQRDMGSRTEVEHQPKASALDKARLDKELQEFRRSTE